MSQVDSPTQRDATHVYVLLAVRLFLAQFSIVVVDITQSRKYYATASFSGYKDDAGRSDEDAKEQLSKRGTATLFFYAGSIDRSSLYTCLKRATTSKVLTSILTNLQINHFYRLFPRTLCSLLRCCKLQINHFYSLFPRTLCSSLRYRYRY